MVSDSSEPRGGIAWQWPLLVLCVFALLLQALSFLPFIADDALISLRYARRLIDGHGLTWSDGPAVEGYSNLLWILLIAPFGAFGFDLIQVARALGLLGMQAALLCMACWSLRSPRVSGFAAASGMLFFSTAAPIGAWAIGGLELPLIAALMAAAIPLYWRCLEPPTPRLAPWALSLLLGLSCLTRPDAPIFVVSILLSLWLADHVLPGRWRMVAMVAALPLVCLGGQQLFRLLYYGSAVPNPALVKLTPSVQHLAEGVDYVWRGLLGMAPASLLALASLGSGVWRKSTRARFLPLAIFSIVWLLYLALIGGDHFPTHRQFVPLVVVFTYALIVGLDELASRLQARPRAMLKLGVGVMLAMTVLVQVFDSRNRAAGAELWEWEGRALGLTLKGVFGEQQPLLAVTAAGCLPYWSEFPALDMLGLNDHYLPRHKPSDIGSGELGHELGDAEYLLRRAPDIIVFHVGSGILFRYQSELADNRQFWEQYVPMQVRTKIAPQYDALVWFRVGSEKVGIRKTANGLTVPAHLFNLDPSTVASVEGERFVVAISRDQPVGVKLHGLDGEWKIKVNGSHPEAVEARLERAADQLVVRLTTSSPTPVSVASIELIAASPARD